ncbi:uncharacterized protein LOC133814796 [Humulus lupulus]|uniref:uncharacterized protein LOC133814796 n=1 Tax=Humulus lupulus TaxID=3486 RepID=UPI002B408CB0|nr:uncharacterized protein LOC133814796 [Humulus lupulus]
MTRAGIELVVGQLANVGLQSTLLNRIMEAQMNNPQLVKNWEDVFVEVAKDFTILKMDMLRYKDQICVSMDAGIKREIMDESHTTPYSLHSVTRKIYRDLKILYWWLGMTKDVVEYVVKCLTCQQVKFEHQRTVGLL